MAAVERLDAIQVQLTRVSVFCPENESLLQQAVQRLARPIADILTQGTLS